MTDFGHDFSCIDDFDPALRTVSGIARVAQAAYHRVTNVSVFGDTDAHVNFGIDVRTMLNAPETDIASAVDEAIQRDRRVLDTTTTVTRTTGESIEEVNLTIRVEIDTAIGPFDLVLAVSALTVDILEGAQ
jgi:hypothetical protein